MSWRLARVRDGLAASLEACDPVEPSSLRAEPIESALDELADGIAERPRPPLRSRRPRRIRGPRAALLVGAAVVAVGAGIASGALSSAHTGRYPTKAERAMGGPGEALNPAASDFHAVALRLASDIPYPHGYESWREFVLSGEIRSADDAALVSSGALHGWFAASAFCAWVRAWRDADVAGDARSAARAARIVSEAPTWKAVSAEDPHPAPSVRGDDPRSTTYTLFGWMLPYRSAVLAGDRTAVERLLASGYGDKCWTSDPAWRAQLAAHPDWGRLSTRRLAENYRRYLAGTGT